MEVITGRAVQHDVVDDAGVPVRGAIVALTGLQGKPELNGRWALVLGARTDSGRLPLALVPSADTVKVATLAVKPENASLLAHPPSLVATTWHNLGHAYERGGDFEEAAAAYDVAIGLSAEPVTLAAVCGLCWKMKHSGRGDPDAVGRRLARSFEELFRPAGADPELRGLELEYGVGGVPGYNRPMMFMGAREPSASRGQFRRQWVWDEKLGDLCELFLPGQLDDGPAAPAAADAAPPVRQHAQEQGQGSPGGNELV